MKSPQFSSFLVLFALAPICSALQLDVLRNVSNANVAKRHVAVSLTPINLTSQMQSRRQPDNPAISSATSVQRGVLLTNHMEAVAIVAKVSGEPKHGKTLNKATFVQLDPALSSLDVQLADAKSQDAGKKLELKVQQSLFNEKQDAMLDAENRSIEVRKRADELRKEADVAAMIAKEEKEAAVIAQKESAEAETIQHTVVLQETEVRKFLKQTTAEASALELEIQQAKVVRSFTLASKTAPMSTTSVSRSVPQKTSAFILTVSTTAVVSRSAAPNTVALANQRSLSASAVAPSPVGAASFAKLQEENERLKMEKSELEHKLSEQRRGKQGGNE